MPSTLPALRRLVPGLLLCGAVTACAAGLEWLEAAVAGRAWLESLVLAILLGTAMRTFGRLPAACEPGIHFGAKYLLELAVVLLGASVSARALLDNGPLLIGGIALVVGLAIALSYAIGRGVGLPRKMALLIACGNAICGNSAIAAVAPAIDAEGDDVAASIAFTAVLGVVVVLVLPLGAMLLSLSPTEFGVFAGLTVYAVPQVLAATAAASPISMHVGTLVKLVRVLMLGPVVLTLSLLRRGRGTQGIPLSQLAPWFITGFLVMLALRSCGLVPHAFLAPAQALANVLTVMSMAALGLGVDARAVLRAGARVAVAVVLSLAGLAVLGFALIRLLGL